MLLTPADTDWCWDAVDRPELAGYYVRWSSERGCFPAAFKITVAAPATCPPFDTPNPLPGEIQYVDVTWFDTEGNESTRQHGDDCTVMM